MLSVQEEWYALPLQPAAEVQPETRLKWWTVIEKHYSEPQRHYHTLDHVGELLRLINAQTMCAELLQLKLCAFFHDLIYDPRSQENEAHSATQFRVFAADVDLGSQLTEEISEAVMFTANHSTAEPKLLWQRLFLDLDLSVLGWQPDKYRQYRQQIRQEYAHVLDQDFRAGRSRILAKFLQCPTLYKTKQFQDSHEAMARANLQEEIVFLNSRE